LRARLYDSEGNAMMEDKDTEVSLTIATSNGSDRPLGNMKWHRSWKLYYKSFKRLARLRRVHIEATAKINKRTVAKAEIDFLDY